MRKTCWPSTEQACKRYFLHSSLSSGLQPEAGEFLTEGIYGTERLDNRNGTGDGAADTVFRIRQTEHEFLFDCGQGEDRGNTEKMRDPSKIGRRKPVPCVPCDFAGGRHTGDVLPGPFSTWDTEISFLNSDFDTFGKQKGKIS